jgi:transketolase
VVFIGSDLGPGVLEKFKKNFPERFFMEGVAEQLIVGMAAGLALEGFIPYVNTIATFLSRRCFEQNVIDLGLHNTNVRLISNAGGTVYAPLGPTHLAIEDIAIMRTIPNMTIVSPADADEMRRLMMQTLDYEGPIYIRLGKGYDPIITSDKFPFEIGKGILIKEGLDLLIVTTGIALGLALEASDQLEKNNINTSVLHMHTIKPLDKEVLIKAVDKVPAVITLEDHTILGGLGSACAEIILEEGFNEKKSFKRIGIPDVFPEGYGNQKDMMARYGISVSEIVENSKDLLRI